MSLAIAAVAIVGIAAVALAIWTGRRRVAIAAAVAAIAVAAVLGSVHRTFIGGYRQIDDFNLELQVLGASPIWRSVTERTETGSTISIAVSEISQFQLGAGFGDERIAYVVITLEHPFGDRQVIDAATGAAIPRIAQGAVDPG